MEKQRGFIALMSVIIIAAVLLMMIASSSGIAFRGRFDALDYENKKISVGLAEACARTAMLKLAQNPNYRVDQGSVGESVVVEAGKTSCKICQVLLDGQDYIIKTRAARKVGFPAETVFTNLSVSVAFGGSDFTVNFWSETDKSQNSSTCIPE